MIEQLVDGGLRIRGRAATSTSASRASPTTAGSRAQRPDKVEEQEPNPLKEDPRDFALWKANKAGEDTWWDSPWGPRPARLAHRVLGDGGEVPRAGVRDPRRRARPRLPAPRERDRAVARARARVRPDLDAQRDAASSTGEKMSKSLGNIVSLREALDDVGARDAARLLPHRPLAQAARLLGRDARAGGRAGRALPRRLPRPVRAARRGRWERFAAALDDDFNTPDALAVMHDWRDHELLRRALERLRARVARRAARGAGRGGRRWPSERLRARGPSDFDEADRLRGEIEAAAGRCATSDDGFQLVPRS